MEIKYIYFEIKFTKGGSFSTEPKITNENVLMIKPHTNSSGNWGFTNITERTHMSEKIYTIVDQNWIDLEKYKFGGYSISNKLDQQIKECLILLKEKTKTLFRTEKLKRILNKNKNHES